MPKKVFGGGGHEIGGGTGSVSRTAPLGRKASSLNQASASCFHFQGGDQALSVWSVPLFARQKHTPLGLDCDLSLIKTLSGYNLSLARSNSLSDGSGPARTKTTWGLGKKCLHKSKPPRCQKANNPNFATPGITNGNPRSEARGR